MKKYIFLDTNYFEHFPTASDVNWLKLANCESAALLVAPITIAELNKHKDTSSRSKQRERATAALRFLSDHSKQSPPAYVRNDVEIGFVTKEPSIDFAAYQLSPDVPDDRLLATAMEFAVENALSRETVLVATADLGLELKARTKSEISIFPLPDALRLPDQLDEDTRRIRELETEIRALKVTFPRLALVPSEDQCFATLTLLEPLSLESEDIEGKIKVLRTQLPYLAAHPAPPNGWAFANLAPRLLDDYNQTLTVYFEKMRSWLQDGVEIYKWLRLTPQLRLRVKNNGGVPATDVELTIHFPDGFDVLEQEQLRKFGAKPEPPLLPDEKIRRFLRPPSIDFSGFNPPAIERLGARVSPRVRILSIEKGNSHIVRLNVPVVKHHRQEELPAIFVHFSDDETAKPFNLDYEILAGNHPNPFTGSLNVLVKN